jgi:hypothetical protein
MWPPKKSICLGRDLAFFKKMRLLWQNIPLNFFDVLHFDNILHQHFLLGVENKCLILVDNHFQSISCNMKCMDSKTCCE